MVKKTNDENKEAKSVEISSGASASDSLKLIKDTLDSNRETVYMPTGNIGFDLALSEGKGLPIGASILLWADPGCGKSTLLADISKRLLDGSKARGEAFRVLYIAAEGSRTLMNDMGLGEYMDSKQFIYVERCLTWRQIEILYDEILNGKHEIYKDVKVVIIDSVNNILSDANIKKSSADGDYGTRAKERSSFYSKFFPVCKERGVNTFLISQVRHNQDAVSMYGDAKKAAVSYADKHNVDIILKCSKSTSTNNSDIDENYTTTIFAKEKDVEKFILRMTSCAADCKNRYCKGLPSEVLMVQGKGADNAYVIRKLLEAYKLVKSGGGWYSFDPVLAEALKFPTNNLRKDALMDLIRTNAGLLVDYLKENGYYGLRVRDDVGTPTVIKEEDTPRVETSDSKELNLETPKDLKKKGK